MKNVLVVAAPAAAGRLLEPEVLVPSLVAFVAFCMASSSIYLVNDIADREADRLHPVKRNRAIASGRLAVSHAAVLSGVLGVGSVVLSLSANRSLALLVVAYLVMQLAYSLRLKHEPVLDLAIVALGFLLRAVAGGFAADIDASRWFLMVAGFGSLFVVAAKRHSELTSLGSMAGTRRSLRHYSESYLRFVWSMAAGATVLAYSLWAFETEAVGDFPWKAVSVIPFVLGILRYGIDVDHGVTGDPEEVVFSDRMLQVIGVVWVVTIALGVSHG